MSSILKALKKLEQERPQQAYPRIWIRGEGRSHGLSRGLRIFLVVTLLAVAGGAAYYQLGRSATKSAAPALKPLPAKRAHPSEDVKVALKATSKSEDRQKTQSAPAVSTPPSKTPVASVRRPTGPRTRPDMENSVAPLDRPETKKPAGPPPPMRVGQRPQPVGQPQATHQLPSARKSIAGQAAQVNRQPADPSIGATLPSPVLSAKTLTGTELKIQAISWSRAPEDRLAVINSQIVREGATIDGYRVTQINTDDLILSKDGLNWTLKFEHK